MKKRLLKLHPIFLLAGLLLMAGAGVASVEEMFSVYKFGGINTETNPLFLPDNSTPDSQNVVTDTGPGLGPRPGYVSFSTETTSTQGWNFAPSNGTKYHIVREGATLKATSGNGTYTAIISTTVATAVNTAAAQLGDRWFYTNTTDGLKYWDGATVTVASSSLTAGILVAYKGRLLASGVTSTPRTIYISKFADGTTWTAASEATTEADSVQVGGGLDEKINGIYSSFNGVAIWFRNSSFGSLDGSRRGGFSLRTFSDVVGTAYPESAQDCDGVLRFLGPRKAVYEWDGAQLKRISDPIRTLLGTVAQGDANSRSYVATVKTDFDAGTNYQTSNAITSGDVMPSTWTATDTLTADFSAGSTSNTTVQSDKVYLSTNSTNLTNNSFESGSGADADGWTRSADVASFGRTSAQAFSGTYSMSLGTISNIETVLIDTSGSVIAVIDTWGGSVSWAQRVVSAQSYAGRWVKIRIRQNARQTNYFETSDYILFSGSLSYYEKTVAGTVTQYFDLFEGGQSTIFTGTFTSRAFNTSLSSAAWLSSGASWTTNGHSISVQTQSSSDGSSWQTAVAWSTGSAPGSDFRKYIRYIVSFSTGGTTNGTALPYVDDVTLAARANFGTWVSQAIALGSPSGFGVFTEDTSLDSGSVVYAIYTDTDTSMTITNGVPVAATYVASATVTNNNIPAVSTAAYVRLGGTYSITTSTNNPTTHSVSIQWSEGSLLPVPGAWYNQRYWLPVAVNGSSNNRVLVYDRNHEWQLYNAVNCVWTTVYNGNLLFGNTSGIFQGDSGTTDNGTSITAYYKTKDFPLNGVDKKFLLDYLINTTASYAGTLGTQYFVNGRTTGTSLGNMTMNTDTGLNVLRLNIPTDDTTQSMRTAALKFSVTGSTSWKLLMSNFYFQREPEVE